MRRVQICFVAAVSLLLIAAPTRGRGSTKQATTGSETQPTPISAKDFNPKRFARSTVIDNAWLPMRPGTQLVFQGWTGEGKERVPHRLVTTVTGLTKMVGGIRSVVLWDRDFSAGELAEAELAFFAQDNAGNIWEMGEYPEEYEKGKVIESPAWIHGVKSARAGITMRAEPRLGTPSYSLGWGPAVGFNDRAKVLLTGQSRCVPVRCYDDVLVVDEFNPGEPGKHQLKYYARGVGNIRVGWTGGNETSKETLVLVEVRRLNAKEIAYVDRQAEKLERSAYTRSKQVYGLTPPLTVG